LKPDRCSTLAAGLVFRADPDWREGLGSTAILLSAAVALYAWGVLNAARHATVARFDELRPRSRSERGLAADRFAELLRGGSGKTGNLPRLRGESVEPV